VPWFSDHPIIDAEVATALASAHMSIERGVDLLKAETALQSGFALLLTRHTHERPVLSHVAGDWPRVRTMQERLRHDLTAPITLTALASSVGLSPFHASRLFMRTVGIPPHAWRNQLRINTALRWLRSGMSVTEAAQNVGFFDQSHFTRHFKRAYGVSPGVLVKRTHDRKNIQVLDASPR
jgi:AraC-like DNA-binding protein